MFTVYAQDTLPTEFKNYKKRLFITLRAEASEDRAALEPSRIWIHILEPFDIIASVTSCLLCSDQTISKYNQVQCFSNFSLHQKLLGYLF